MTSLMKTLTGAFALLAFTSTSQAQTAQDEYNWYFPDRTRYVYDNLTPETSTEYHRWFNCIIQNKNNDDPITTCETSKEENPIAAMRWLATDYINFPWAQKHCHLIMPRGYRCEYRDYWITMR